MMLFLLLLFIFCCVPRLNRAEGGTLERYWGHDDSQASDVWKEKTMSEKTINAISILVFLLLFAGGVYTKQPPDMVCIGSLCGWFVTWRALNRKFG